MAKYGPKAAEKVKRSLEKIKKGTLESEKIHTKVPSRKQTAAIGLSEARKTGGKVPTKKRQN